MLPCVHTEGSLWSNANSVVRKDHLEVKIRQGCSHYDFIIMTFNNKRVTSSRLDLILIYCIFYTFQYLCNRSAIVSASNHQTTATAAGDSRINSDD